jgi:PAS domain S-box-containing protein
VENIPGMVYMYDVNENGVRIPIIRTSRNEEFLGKKLASIIKEDYNKFFDHIVEEDRHKLNELSKQIEISDNTYIYEYRIQIDENKTKWFRSIGRVRNLENGYTRWQGVILDIDEQKNAEKAIIRAAHHWQSTFDATKDAIWIMDNDQNILQANKAATTIFNKSKEELLSKFCYENAHLTKKPIKDCPFLRMKKTLKRESMELNLKDDVWLHITVDPILDSKRILIGAVHIARDITDRKLIEKELALHREHLEKLVETRTKDLKQKTLELEEANVELLEADRLKSIFLASMSHELRTPLNSIIGFTGILLMGMVGDLTEEQRKQLTIVKESASHLLELINDILDISKVEAGKVELSSDLFDVNEVIEEQIRSIEPKAFEKGIGLKRELTESIEIVADNRRFKQILLNLLSNAVKFTETGSVTISSAIVKDSIQISVIDTGVGIKQEDMKKLFEPFQQIDSSLTKKHEGTGLGLHLTEKIVKLMQGKIWVESEINKGTAFHVSLPLIKAET